MQISKSILKNKETLLVLAFAITGVILFQALQGPQPKDDACITFRYARNLEAGAGFVDNPRQPKPVNFETCESDK
jgi:hypothetical protein